jgi:hypothetical protein
MPNHWWGRYFSARNDQLIKAAVGAERLKISMVTLGPISTRDLKRKISPMKKPTIPDRER